VQEKSEVFGAFKTFKARVEKNQERPLKLSKQIGMKNTTQMSLIFACEEHDIKKKLTPTYTPQQNGVLEKKNRTILNMVRGLLTQECVPKTFCPKALNWSIHVLNRSLTFVIQNMILKEAWSGKRLTIDYFRIFECVACTHISYEMRKKFVDK